MVRVWLRDDQFERIAALLPGKASDPGRTAADNRLFVEAVLWIARTGSPWRDLPPQFGPWNSVYQRFARGSRSGVWHEAQKSGEMRRVVGTQPTTTALVQEVWISRGCPENGRFLDRGKLLLFRVIQMR